MALNFKVIWTGARFKPVSTLTSDSLGEVQSFLTDSKTYLHNGTTRSPIVTEAQTSTLTNKTIDADNNTISNLEVDNLKAGVLNTSTTLAAASDLQVPSALAVKTYVDNTFAPQTDVADLVTLTGVPVNSTDLGTFTGTTIPDASTIKSALQSLETGLEDHISDTVDAHDASAISVVAIPGVTGTEVQAVLEDLKDQIDATSGDVVGPASSTDNTIARFDGITGKLIQNSVVTVSDTGVIAGSSIDADTNTITNIENADIKTGANIARNKLASGTANAVVHNDGSGVMSNSTDLLVGTNALTLQNTKHLELQAATDAATTGSNASLTAFTAGGVRLTNVSLTSLANIPAGANGQELTIFNRTGNAVNIVDSSAALGTAANRILTGTNATISLVDNSAITLTYDSTTARWQVMGGTGSGSSGMGGINYITNFNAENDLTGWVTYADAAGTAPVDGTGGSPTVTLTRSTSSPLRGTASFLYTKPASNVQGQGFSYDFTIDPADQGKVLQGSFEYQIASGTFADNDLSVWIYDVTNARMIQPAPYLIKNSGIIERFPLEFQTAINSTSYRLIAHQASASTSAYTVKFDTFNVGPQAKLYGSAVTDWVSYTPTATGLTLASSNFKYSRQGGDLLVEAGFKLSATSATAASFTLPSGLSVDTTRQAQINGGVAGVGYFNSSNGAGGSGVFTASASGLVFTESSEPTKIFMSLTNNTDASNNVVFSKNNGSTLFNATANVYLTKIRIPIQGWSSSQIMSSDANTRVVTARAHRATDQSLTNSVETKIALNTVGFDDVGAFELANNRYIAKVAGKYRVSGSVGYNTNGTGVRVAAIRKNGAETARVQSAASSVSASFAVVSDIVTLNVGDYVELFGLQNSGGALDAFGFSSYTFLALELISGPAQIAASESVSALYTGAPPTGTLNGSVNIVTFGTKVKDSHNAYASGSYTVPTSGVFDIKSTYNTQHTSSTADLNCIVYIYIDGVSAYSKQLKIPAGLTRTQPSVEVGSVPLLAGQVVTIRSSTSLVSPSYLADTSTNFFSITRTGQF